jgi:hypothetical protein
MNMYLCNSALQGQFRFFLEITDLIMHDGITQFHGTILVPVPCSQGYSRVRYHRYSFQFNNICRRVQVYWIRIQNLLRYRIRN